MAFHIGPASRWGLAVAVCATVTATIIGDPVTSTAGPVRAHTAGMHSSPSDFTDSNWGDPLADLAAKVSGRNSVTKDPGSLYTIENAIGARTVWGRQDASRRPITGRGVSVALLDSGTADVAGLDNPGKLTYGPDLSVEANGPLTDEDTFGHGTFMAGIIAARDGGTALASESLASADPSTQLGVAPDAGLVSLKLADSDGSSDVSQIIAALNWVTEHPVAADGSRIRVINLSYGTDSVQAYQADPLAAAAENAWKHGIVVVVSAGNEGTSAGRLTDPAMDPYVLAVGASDGKDTIGGWNTPAVAPFSNSGTRTRHVDIVAPGSSVVSLRDPGSFIDVNHPEGLVAGDTTGRLFRGSGTSQAAAVVSGSVALMLQANPTLTPDQVKAAIIKTATPIPVSPIYAGAGQINVAAAVTAVQNLTGFNGAVFGQLTGLSSAAAAQTYPASTGYGSLDAARGGSGLLDADGNPIDGEVDAQGNPWDAKAWWSAASTLTSWNGGSWMGTVWTGDGWTPGDNGKPTTWSSARWSSARWSDADWSSARWSSARWSSARWSDDDWG